MNERIRQLAEQAGASMLHGGELSFFGNTSIEKFAELIVRECADIATINSHQWHSAGRFVLTHFGVEE